MNTQQQLRQAILDNDYGLAASLLGALPRTPQSLQEAGEIKHGLLWALSMLRLNRAHDAARLAAQMRAAAYVARHSDAHPTWALDV